MKLCPQCRNTYPIDYQSCPRDLTPLVENLLAIGVGDILRGKYEVLSQVGVGGMATVYKVLHRPFQEIAAVKLVHSHFLHDPEFIKRFRNEAVVARQLRHPNAVRIDDFDYTDDGRPFIVMEFVDGRSLYDSRKIIPGPWPIDQCIRIVAQTSEALGAAHALGITHRDIKPSNIVLLWDNKEQFQVKVLDFGIAKTTAGNSFAGMTTVLTQQGLVIGTPEYMSPEQATGRLDAPIDGRSDLYSLGLVLYEMITGSHPFEAGTPMGMLIQQLNTHPAPPDSIYTVPPAVSALVLKLLQKDPNDRFQSAAELLRALHDPELWFAIESDRSSPRSHIPVSVTERTAFRPQTEQQLKLSILSKYIAAERPNPDLPAAWKSRRIFLSTGTIVLVILASVGAYMVQANSARRTATPMTTTFGTDVPGSAGSGTQTSAIASSRTTTDVNLPKKPTMIEKDSKSPNVYELAGAAHRETRTGRKEDLRERPAERATTAAPSIRGPVRIAAATVAGNALIQPSPIYPPIARAAHVHGVVVLHALISKAGTVEDLTVISGPPMLQSSAIDAVRHWRYKPYLLNGEATEVETTINVAYTFGE